MDIYRDDNGLHIGNLHSCDPCHEHLLELHEYAHAACGDDTLATVFARSDVEPEASQEQESFGRPSSRTVFGEDVEACITLTVTADGPEGVC
jgi:hypothetical protein